MGKQEAYITPAWKGARLIQVIETTIARTGNGKDDPFRTVIQYWTLDGSLLAEHDTLRPFMTGLCGTKEKLASEPADVDINT